MSGLTIGPWTYRTDPVPRECCGKCGQTKPREPWNYLIEGRGRALIAKVWVHVGNGHSDEENARLISAAPDLLAACQKLDELDWCIGYELSGEDNHKILDAALDMARAAIRKAIKGEAI